MVINSNDKVKMIRRFKSILVLIGILLVISGLLSCQGRHSGPVESMTIGAQLLESFIPLFIAQDQEFFRQNGLDVTLKGYDTGLAALNSMLNGEVDVATSVSEYILVAKILDNQPVKTFGSLDKGDFISIVARKDRGILSPQDLRGKKIGTLPKTNADFFLSRYFELQGMSKTDVTYVDIGTLQQSVDAVVSGRVDAVISFPPFDKMAREQLANNTTVFPVQSRQFVQVLLVCDNDWLRVHSNISERLLKAINQADEYIAQHPQEAKAIAKKKLNLTDEDISRVWSQNRFSLSLDQSLIVAMNDEARWMISNNLTTEKTVPNFKDYIYLDVLKAVKPEAVDIIK